MKVFALAILLVSLYYIEGAVVKRESGGEEPAATTSPDILSQYLPNLKETMANTGKMFEQLRVFFSDDMTERFTQAFNSMLDSAKRAIQ